MPAVIDPGPRKAERVRAVTMVVLDVEAKATVGSEGKRVAGPLPPEIPALAAELERRGWKGIVSSTYNHGADLGPRYRVALLPSRVLEPKEVRLFAQHVARVLGLSDCWDQACAEPARLYYLPRCPPDRLHLVERAIVEGGLLPVDELLKQARAIDEPAPRRAQESNSVIKKFNDAASIDQLLEHGGYQHAGGDRWLWPGSTTGVPGVVHLRERGRVFSAHANDPLSGCGHAHDAFGVWAILEHGGDVDAALRAAAKILGIERTKEPRAAPAAAVGDVQLVRGDAVPLTPVRWLWPGYLPASMLTIIGGAPGCGKTTIALSLGAVATRGGTWPDNTQCEGAGDVIVWSGEDDRGVLAARLTAAGADMGRVHFVVGTGTGTFDPARDMQALEDTARGLAAPRLLICDPIVSAVAGDSHKGAEVRRALQPMVDLAQRLKCAVLGITHFSKGTADRDPTERITGSIAFAALARVVLVAAKVKAEPGDDSHPRRVLMRAKSNIGPDDGGYAYELERVEVAPEVEGQRVRWLEALQGTARELLTEADHDHDGEGGGHARDIDAFLRGLLADGPVPAKALRTDADGAGWSWRAVQRAATRLGVERRKLGMRAGWVWALANAPKEPEGAEGAEGDIAESADCSDALATGAWPRPPKVPDGARPVSVGIFAPSESSMAPSQCNDEEYS